MFHFITMLLVSTAAVAVSLPAAAAEPEVDAAIAPDPRESRWYGETIVKLDAAGVSLQLVGAVGVASDNSGLAIAGLVPGSLVTVLSGPAVHFTRGRVGAGLGSFGLRLALPFVGAMSGAVIGSEPAESETDHSHEAAMRTGVALGVTAGFMVASAIDVAFLSYEEVPHTGFWIAPTVRIAGDVRSVGLAGQF